MTHRLASRWPAAALLVVASAGLAAPAPAQDVPKGREIHIHMAGSRSNPEGPNPYRILKVLPNTKGLCRGAANHREDCQETVAWVLKGPDLPAGWQVELRQKASSPKSCFAAAPFILKDDKPVDSGMVDEKACNRFDVWAYDIVLIGNGAEKGREDPLVVLNY